MELELKWLKTGDTFIYKDVIWKTIPVFRNSWAVTKYLGKQEGKELCSLVKCQPKIAGIFQMTMAKYFNTETMVETI